MRIKKKVYSTWCSQAVTHLSTDHARRCLTSVIGREPVFSTWYGRRHESESTNVIMASQCRPLRFNKCSIFFYHSKTSLALKLRLLSKEKKAEAIF